MGNGNGMMHGMTKANIIKPGQIRWPVCQQIPGKHKLEGNRPFHFVLQFQIS
jgi:hypothetical protein